MKRGWNVLLVDLPGRGSNPQQGMTSRHDAEAAFGAVVDGLVARHDVDPGRITSCGVNVGGYPVLRAPAHERPLAAIALRTPVPEVHKRLADGTRFPIYEIPSFLGDALSKLSKYSDPASQLAVERWLVAVGTDSLKEAVEIFEKRRWTGAAWSASPSAW